MKVYLIFLAICFVSLPGKSQKPYIVSDLTAENEFTHSCEGPAVDQKQNLFAVNFGTNGTIAIISPEKTPRLFVTLPEGSTGNGIRFNRKGDMFVADYTGHNVLQVDTKTREIKVYAHNDKFNQPNDLAISNSGILFLSDPNWKNNTGQLWKVMPDGQVMLLTSDMGTINGIEVSPDDKHLYVNESIQRNLWAFDLDAEGNISNKRLILQFPDFGLMACVVIQKVIFT